MQKELMAKSDIERALLACARQNPGCKDLSSADIVECAEPHSSANWELGVYVPGSGDSKFAYAALCECAARLAKIYDMAGPWLVEVHAPNIGRGSLEQHFENLTARAAIAVMEANLNKGLVLRQRGDVPAPDLEALDAFQQRTGKRIERMFA